MEEERELNKKVIIVILAITTIIIYAVIFFLIDKDDMKKKENTYEIVTNYSEFYTVSSCANKYISFLADKNAESLLNVLDDKFKNENALDATNVTVSLPFVAAGTTFRATRMYFQEQKGSIFKYYIAGYLETGGLDMTDISRVESYLIIYLDKEKNLFSVEPYDGLEYKEGVLE